VLHRQREREGERETRPWHESATYLRLVPSIYLILTHLHSHEITRVHADISWWRWISVLAQRPYPADPSLVNSTGRVALRSLPSSHFLRCVAVGTAGRSEMAQGWADAGTGGDGHIAACLPFLRFLRAAHCEDAPCRSCLSLYRQLPTHSPNSSYQRKRSDDQHRGLWRGCRGALRTQWYC